MIKGLHYRSPEAYQLLTSLLLGKHDRERFEIAAELLSGARSVLDICAGTGLLKESLPDGCLYEALDASPEFVRYLRQKKITSRLGFVQKKRFLESLPGEYDAVVMIISLCQFRPYDLDGIIQEIKRFSKKCVIVEDVKKRPSPLNEHLMNYFCARDYFKPCSVFERSEFEELMIRHGFVVRHHGARYSSAVYG